MNYSYATVQQTGINRLKYDTVLDGNSCMDLNVILLQTCFLLAVCNIKVHALETRAWSHMHVVEYFCMMHKILILLTAAFWAIRGFAFPVLFLANWR